jgi:putative oxidoreductase
VCEKALRVLRAVPSGHDPVMSYGLLFLRVIAGTTLFAHGAQKLFGWFEGPGPRGTGGYFGSLGFRAPLAMALAAGLSETTGLLFALGFLTPFAAVAMASVMVVAVGSIHWKNGFWVTNGGFEYNLLVWTVVASVAAIGPGRFSIDNALGFADNLSGLWWGVGVLAVSLAGGLLVLATREAQPEPGAADEPITREAEPVSERTERA